MRCEAIELQATVVVIKRLASVRPLITIESIGNGVARKELSIEDDHRVRKAAPRSLLGECNGCLPLFTTILRKHTPCFWAAAYIELPFVTGDAIQRAAVARLTAIFP